MNTITIQGETPAMRITWLRQLLSTGVYDITFTKINGETRIMPCTLESSKLPLIVVKENAVVRPEPTDTMRVWCIDKQAWRSFKVMSVTDIKEPGNGK